MKLSKIFHREEFRIKLEFDYDKSITTALMKQIELRWSQTHKAWHAPYKKVVFNKILEIYPNAVYEKKPEKETFETPKQETQSTSPEIKSGNIKIVVLPKLIHIILPKKMEQIAILLDFTQLWPKS
jgi:integrase/recombinase XerD